MALVCVVALDGHKALCYDTGVSWTGTYLHLRRKHTEALCYDTGVRGGHLWRKHS